MKASNLDIGKAYKAWLAFNHKAKKGRVESFDLNRWINVIHALNGTKRIVSPKGLKGTGTWERKSTPSKKWTKEHYAKYYATIDKRRKEAAST